MNCTELQRCLRTEPGDTMQRLLADPGGEPWVAHLVGCLPCQRALDEAAAAHEVVRAMLLPLVADPIRSTAWASVLTEDVVSEDDATSDAEAAAIAGMSTGAWQEFSASVARRVTERAGPWLERPLVVLGPRNLLVQGLDGLMALGRGVEAATDLVTRALHQLMDSVRPRRVATDGTSSSGQQTRHAISTAWLLAGTTPVAIEFECVDAFRFRPRSEQGSTLSGRLRFGAHEGADLQQFDCHVVLGGLVEEGLQAHDSRGAAEVVTLAPLVRATAGSFDALHHEILNHRCPATEPVPIEGCLVLLLPRQER